MGKSAWFGLKVPIQIVTFSDAKAQMRDKQHFALAMHNATLSCTRLSFQSTTYSCNAHVFVPLRADQLCRAIGGESAGEVHERLAESNVAAGGLSAR
jgi:hypothetical protein